MGEKLGIETALSEAMAEVDEPAAAEQLDLLPLDRPREGEAQGVVARGPGRPPGARNKRTVEMIDYLLSRYASPLEALAQAYSVPVDELAKRLRCKRLDAMKVQIEAASRLAPYVHQKQPVAVQVDGKGVVQLVLTDPASIAAMAAEGDGQVIEAEILDNEENQ